MPEPEVTTPTPPADPPQDPPADPPPGDPPAENNPDEFVDDNADPDKYSIGDEDPTPPNTPAKPSIDPVNEVPEEDELAIGKVVDKKLDGVTKQLNSVTDRLYKQSVETDLSKILTDHPEYKPYEARIRRFVTHDNRFKLIKQGLPVNTVVIEAVAPYLQQIGAAKAKAADEKANKTKVNGQAAQASVGSKPDYSKMSNKEITEMGEAIKSGQYKPQ